jgi:hypothetical protein
MSMDIKEHQDAMSRQYRQVAGLPERKNNKPHDVSKPSELRRYAEPEGGYGDQGETEVDERAGVVDKEVVEEMQRGEELSAKSGQGNTTAADASTGPTADVEGGVSGAGKKPAKKTAKKTAKKS